MVPYYNLASILKVLVLTVTTILKSGIFKTIIIRNGMTHDPIGQLSRTPFQGIRLTLEDRSKHKLNYGTTMDSLCAIIAGIDRDFFTYRLLCGGKILDDRHTVLQLLQENLESVECIKAYKNPIQEARYQVISIFCKYIQSAKQPGEISINLRSRPATYGIFWHSRTIEIPYSEPPEKAWCLWITVNNKGSQLKFMGVPVDEWLSDPRSVDHEDQLPLIQALTFIVTHHQNYMVLAQLKGLVNPNPNKRRINQILGEFEKSGDYTNVSIELDDPNFYSIFEITSGPDTLRFARDRKQDSSWSIRFNDVEFYLDRGEDSKLSPLLHPIPLGTSTAVTTTEFFSALQNEQLQVLERYCIS
jgi:hypothetical protein